MMKLIENDHPCPIIIPLHKIPELRHLFVSKMPESLLNKYPHLKLLLSEKRGNLADEKKVAAKTETLPDDIIAPPRKSILGPGVGPRIDLKPPVKTYDSNR